MAEWHAALGYLGFQDNGSLPGPSCVWYQLPLRHSVRIVMMPFHLSDRNTAIPGKIMKPPVAVLEENIPFELLASSGPLAVSPAMKGTSLGTLSQRIVEEMNRGESVPRAHHWMKSDAHSEMRAAAVRKEPEAFAYFNRISLKACPGLGLVYHSGWPSLHHKFSTSL